MFMVTTTTTAIHESLRIELIKEELEYESDFQWIL